MITKRRKKIMKFNIFLQDIANFTDIEANTKEEAIEIALEWWADRMPAIIALEADESPCHKCYNADQDTEDKVACCSCCVNYDFFVPRERELDF
jgi:hypothetical protein